MAVFKITRFEIRPEVRDDAERAMHELASYVRKQLPGSSCAIYRDAKTLTRYFALLRSDNAAADERYAGASGTQVFTTALAGWLAGDVEVIDCELVTSSDLQRRHRR